MPRVPNEELIYGGIYLEFTIAEFWNMTDWLNCFVLKAILFVLGFSSLADFRARFLQQRFRTQWLRYSGPSWQSRRTKAFRSRTYCWCGATLPSSRVWTL